MIRPGQNPNASGVRYRRAAPATFGLLLTLAVFPACKRREKAAAGAPAAGPRPAAAAPTSPPADAPPVIRLTVEPGKPSWAGLAEPRGAALDDAGRVWVADFGHSRVAIFDGSGGYLGGWGGARGNGRYQLQDPADIAIRGQDVYVADTWNGRVQHFTTAGHFRDTTLAELYGPRGVAVATDGAVWIADSGNNRLAVVQAGQPARYLGKGGSGPDGLSSPIGIAAGPSARIFVADIGNHRIQVLGADGKFQRSIPVAAWKDPMEPYVAVDDRENLFVSVPAAGSVLELDRSGRTLRTWAADDAGNKLLKPTGLALDRKSGVLHVVDTASSAIRLIHLWGKKP